MKSLQFDLTVILLKRSNHVIYSNQYRTVHIEYRIVSYSIYTVSLSISEHRDYLTVPIISSSVCRVMQRAFTNIYSAILFCDLYFVLTTHVY